MDEAPNYFSHNKFAVILSSLTRIARYGLNERAASTFAPEGAAENSPGQA